MSSSLANTLIVPGLLGDLPRLGELGELPRFPHLELLLSRAERVPARVGYVETLFDLFGLPFDAAVDLPTAALCYHAEADVEPYLDTFLLHADPVHLRPDQDRLLAFDFHHQGLSADEARQFATAFNQHFAGDGLRLLVPHPQRWYLSVDKPPALRTRALSEVLGRNVDLFLPEGEDAGRWRAWMNELQMLFYNLPINQTRESQGQLAVSGLWFSGGGALPTQSLTGFAQVNGQCLLFEALQKRAKSQADRAAWLEHAPGRAVLDADPSAWVAAVQALDARLGEAMQAPLVLDACDGQSWHWRPVQRRYLWRRVKPLKHWLSA